MTTDSIPVCGKGTALGPAAEASPYGFAACTLPVDHRPPCEAE